MHPSVSGAVAAAATIILVGCSADNAGPSGRSAAPSYLPQAGASTADPDEPTRRLSGAPLTGTTNLKFLVAADPPVIIDADRTGTRSVSGFPRGQDRTVTVYRVGAQMALDSACADCAASDLFVMSPDSARLRRIAGGHSALSVPALDGRGVWVREDKGRCTLTQIWLDGRTRTPARSIDCGLQLLQDTSLGLLWISNDEPSSAVIQPVAGGREVFRAQRIIAVAGRQVLSDDGTTGPFTLTDIDSGRRIAIPRPTTIGEPSPGLLAPDGRTLAVSFDHPAWPGPRQRMDTWMLDLPTRRWEHLPSMPVNAALKTTGMEWTPDGRFVLVGQFDDVGDVLAVWRPGERQLAIRKITIPPSGANSFVSVAVSK